MENKKYGLFTSVTMITGIVIGSGIFFKADDILSYTGGNVLLGVFVFAIAAIAIIFGCLSMSMLAMRTDEPGGLVSYANQFVGRKTASAFGWFQMLLYYPTLIAVVAWIVGMYISTLMGWKGGNLLYTVIGIFAITILFILHMISSKIAAGIQNASMLIKLIPLLLISIVGLFLGNPRAMLEQDITNVRELATSTGWFAAFGPIAFSFDGWIVSTSICHEIKNSKRNLPIALIMSPLLILLCYILYFVGLTGLVGVNKVLALGNDSAYVAADMLFGAFGAKLLLIFVIISVLGTLNGLLIGFMQIPYSLAIRNMLPMSSRLSKTSEKFSGLSLGSVGVTYVLSLFWILVHFLSQRAGMPGDVSEIAVSFSYIVYIVLYVAVIRLAKKGEIKNKFMGYVVPIIAMIGSLIILSGSIGHSYFFYYMIICIIIIGLGYKNGKRTMDLRSSSM